MMQAAARVRRRRLARAAHAADQHPRQPRAASGPARGGRARDGEEGEMVESGAPLLAADAPPGLRPAAARPRRRRAHRCAARVRPRRGRGRGPLRGAPGRRRAPPDPGRWWSGAGRRATRTSFTGWPSTCSTTASATRRPGPRSGSRSSAATATPCSRSPTTGPGSRPAWRRRSSRGSSGAVAPPTCAGDSGTGLGLAIVKAVATIPWRRRRRGLLARRRGAVHGAAARSPDRGSSIEARATRAAKIQPPSATFRILYTIPILSRLDETTHPSRTPPDTTSMGERWPV